jgi:AraC-like DNA-binding protein
LIPPVRQGSNTCELEVAEEAWIRDRRLERCRRDFANPALEDWSVSAIAARWGLIDPAYFSRAFRAAYGLPPIGYRKAAAATTRFDPAV